MSSFGNNKVSLHDKSDLRLEEVYTCPVCQHGQISQMVLMEAFSCNFCRHILSVNLERQTVRLEDSSQAFQWQWDGQTWRSLSQQNIPFTYTLAVVAVALILLPPGLVWLGYYIFPPLPDSDWQWFPLAWAGLTLVTHLGLVLGILLNAYPSFAFWRWRLSRPSR
ncbi:hypothetical protein RIF25_08910 [Thermosynechococcaceae cyanobacterium BACA0444]|uniref:Uncharacterized protein n=1 Tax=Pseudocalidococcus azoricus BACA0444 TaxID=2918990 RepID=A0AAE4FSU8_9CYAN|nr:hypothetical protein [Pseudocalidococcus azoricus]MDS3860932.1 hypothetical protein [Pseudocalidococcus azoricus BACA0444]